MAFFGDIRRQKTIRQLSQERHNAKTRGKMSYEPLRQNPYVQNADFVAKLWTAHCGSHTLSDVL